MDLLLSRQHTNQPSHICSLEQVCEDTEDQTMDLLLSRQHTNQPSHTCSFKQVCEVTEDQTMDLLLSRQHTNQPSHTCSLKQVCEDTEDQTMDLLLSRQHSHQCIKFYCSIIAGCSAWSSWKTFKINPTIFSGCDPDIIRFCCHYTRRQERYRSNLSKY